MGATNCAVCPDGTWTSTGGAAMQGSCRDCSRTQVCIGGGGLAGLSLQLSGLPRGALAPSMLVGLGAQLAQDILEVACAGGACSVVGLDGLPGPAKVGVDGSAIAGVSITGGFLPNGLATRFYSTEFREAVIQSTLKSLGPNASQLEGVVGVSFVSFQPQGLSLLPTVLPPRHVISTSRSGLAPDARISSTTFLSTTSAPDSTVTPMMNPAAAAKVRSFLLAGLLAAALGGA